ncbi:hypothetical protein [Nitratireductor sp. ZSWI3]|uniref:hypothetical protein n=1 Tax=Nitratireductor sp. ZSWI3 TaxID=2966359 RepID=UPI00214FA223|nr:hypothetical protein [Nitratireductor sp. ZSWI3]MCR4265037.1 hypothetical protein [Nitratireductor sp. ZSWI3]
MSMSRDKTQTMPSTLPKRIAPILPWLILAASAALADTDHRDGFMRYARVDRPDGSFRKLFIDEKTLGALRLGQAVSDGASIIMESYSGPDEVRSVFAKKRKNGRWQYGSLNPGEPLTAFRPRPQCSGCHVAANDSDGVFTLSMLQRFAETGEPQEIRCPRVGRIPCDRSVYDTR